MSDWALDVQQNGTALWCRLSGHLDHDTVAPVQARFSKLIRQGREMVVSLADIQSMDSAGGALLGWIASQMQTRGGIVRFVDVPESVRAVAMGLPDADLAPMPAEPGLLFRIGDGAGRSWQALGRFAHFLGDVFVGSIVGLFSGAGRRRGSVTDSIVAMGADAVWVVGLIGLILGLILAFQAAYQLRAFGASIYVANLVGLSAVREMAPVLTAVVVAGRSGSAIAAEIGTMKVGEELDALEVMGIRPIRFLVVPRLLAVTVTQPMLTALSAVMAILGGLAIAVLYLDLGVMSYLNQTLRALSAGDVIHGLGKSILFGWLIVLTGSYSGLTVKASAEAVGKAATRTVVASIFGLILTDGIITTLDTLLK